MEALFRRNLNKDKSVFEWKLWPPRCLNVRTNQLKEKKNWATAAAQKTAVFFHLVCRTTN